MTTAALIVQTIGVSVTLLSVIAQYRADVDMLVRLTQNLERGGSSDPLESQRMGAEAVTLLMALGHDRLPQAYALHVGNSPEKIRGFIDDPAVPEWRRAANEVLMELQRTVERERGTAAHPAESGPTPAIDAARSPADGGA